MGPINVLSSQDYHNKILQFSGFKQTPFVVAWLWSLEVWSRVWAGWLHHGLWGCDASIFLLALHLRWDIHRAIQHLLDLLVSSLLCTGINSHFLEVTHVVLGPILMTSPQLTSGNSISKQGRISHSSVSSLFLVPMFSYYCHIPLTL